MPVHMSVVKDIGGGESITINISQVNPVTGEVEYTNPGEMKEVFDEVLEMAEDRMQDMVTRIMETAQLRQWCSPDEWDKIVSVVDIIAGRVEAHVVAKRWQSKQEENAELAEGRRVAAQQAMVEDMDRNMSDYDKRLIGKLASGHVIDSDDHYVTLDQQ
jgi:hypothetical protein